MANIPAKDGAGNTIYLKANGAGTNDTNAYRATHRLENTSGTEIDPATAGNQTTLIGHVDGIETLLGTIDADTGALVTAIANLATQTTLAALLTELQAKADLTDTQPVSAASLPLPTGAATAANQGTANTSLSTLAGAVAGSEVQVDIVSAPILAVSGPLTDTQLRATAVPVSGAVTANAGTNLNTSALALESGGNLAAIAGNVDGLEAQVGIVTETAPASDTASSGLNGRLQRIAQRLTSLIGLFPTSIGQKANAAAFGVSLSTEQEALVTAIRNAVQGTISVSVSSAITNARTVTSTTATLLASDTIIYYDNTSAGTITIPANLIGDGITIQLMQVNTGIPTIVADTGAGAVLRVPTGFFARPSARWATVAIYARGANEFVMGGLLSTT